MSDYTDELLFMVRERACRQCAGAGTLAWAADRKFPDGSVIPVRGADICERCDGFGFEPNRGKSA